jgi:NitT/TauT family transport system permease protein
MSTIPVRAMPLRGNGVPEDPSDPAGPPGLPAVSPVIAVATPAGRVRERQAPAAVATSPTLPERVGRLPGWLGEQAGSLLLGALSLGGVLLFWHLATTYRWDFYVRFTNLPTPAEVAAQLQTALASQKFAMNVGISLRRIALGFMAAVVLGVSLGLMIGRYRRVRQLMFPALEALRPIPAIAWVPISIMLWPDNEVSIVFITFIGAFFPILLNTVSGVQAVDAVLLRAGQCLGAREPQLMWHVVLPGAAPQIFTGLAVGMGVAWVSLIAAEMISGQFGIGYFTWESYSLISYPDIVLGMITIGVLGLGCSALIRLAGRFALPWLEFTRLGGR